MIEIAQRAAFLSRIHLFNGLSEAQLNAVAAELEERTFEAGEEIVTEGQAGDTFYLIVQGKVRVTQREREKPLATLVERDYFGEEALLSRQHRRIATVTALEKTLTLVLNQTQFSSLLKRIRVLRVNFSVAVSSNRLARRTRFAWLPDEEVIYYLARKHSILLVEALILPGLLVLIGIGGMIFTWWNSYDQPVMQALWWLALFVSIIAGVWALWSGIDWGNDYYIVTNRRVVWLEKVIGIYDSRLESPLSAVQRISVQTDLLGRQFDYGSLVVRTIVGSTLTLKNVRHPYQAAALVEEHWRRAQETSRRMEEEEMKQLLRERLPMGEHRDPKLPDIVARPQSRTSPYKGKRRLADFFRLRFEDKAVITYRKHFVVLLRQTWKPFVLVLALIGILVFLLVRHTLAGAPLWELESVACGWGAVFLGAFFWWLYQYVDWSNDIFQVTPEQILDIDKTPLGEVTSDIASLDNILSIESERQGLWELIFNYGDVKMTIGGGKQMVFENVSDPRTVQDDIERRRLERIARREQEKAKAERERMADWFATYYHSERGFREDHPSMPDDQANPPGGGEPSANN